MGGMVESPITLVLIVLDRERDNESQSTGTKEYLLMIYIHT